MKTFIIKGLTLIGILGIFLFIVAGIQWWDPLRGTKYWQKGQEYVRIMISSKYRIQTFLKMYYTDEIKLNESSTEFYENIRKKNMTITGKHKIFIRRKGEYEILLYKRK